MDNVFGPSAPRTHVAASCCCRSRCTEELCHLRLSMRTPACVQPLGSGTVQRRAAVALSWVPFVHGTIPRPSAFAVRLSRGLVVQLRVRQQAANNRSLGSVRRTGRSLRSGGAYDSRAARQGNQESDTQFSDRNNVTVYHVLQQGAFTSKHLFLIYRWESRGHRITGASTMEPSSVLVTPLGVTRAQ